MLKYEDVVNVQCPDCQKFLDLEEGYLENGHNFVDCYECGETFVVNAKMLGPQISCYKLTVVQ